MSGHCNERRAESGDELEETARASSKNLDTADRQQNTGQLETELMWQSADERGHRGESPQRTSVVYAS